MLLLWRICMHDICNIWFYAKPLFFVYILIALVYYVCLCSDWNFGTRALSPRVYQGILSSPPDWNLLSPVIKRKMSHPITFSNVILLNLILVSCSVGLCPWRSRSARAHASIPPVQAVCWWLPHHALRPAPTPTPPVCTTLGSVCALTWLVAPCATPTCR